MKSKGTARPLAGMLFKGFVRLSSGASKQIIGKPLGLGLSMGKLACFSSSLHVKTFMNLLMISLEIPYSHLIQQQEKNRSCFKLRGCAYH